MWRTFIAAVFHSRWKRRGLIMRVLFALIAAVVIAAEVVPAGASLREHETPSERIRQALGEVQERAASLSLIKERANAEAHMLGLLENRLVVSCRELRSLDTELLFNFAGAAQALSVALLQFEMVAGESSLAAVRFLHQRKELIAFEKRLLGGIERHIARVERDCGGRKILKRR